MSITSSPFTVWPDPAPVRSLLHANTNSPALAQLVSEPPPGHVTLTACMSSANPQRGPQTRFSTLRSTQTMFLPDSGTALPCLLLSPARDPSKILRSPTDGRTATRKSQATHSPSPAHLSLARPFRRSVRRKRKRRRRTATHNRVGGGEKAARKSSGAAERAPSLPHRQAAAHGGRRTRKAERTKPPPRPPAPARARLHRRRPRSTRPASFFGGRRRA